MAICGVDGTVTQMTTKHHAETPVESTRLRRVVGSALVMDSFGEARWMGALENTRSLGDFEYKPCGVTPEPEVREKLLKGNPTLLMVYFVIILNMKLRVRFRMLAYRLDF